MSLPTDVNLADLLAQLERMSKQARDVRRRVKKAVERELKGGRNAPDGYPAAVGGGGNSGISDPTGETVARRQDPHRDKHHEHLVHAIGWLEQTVHSYGAMIARLDFIDELLTGAPVDTRWCEAFAAAGIHVPWDHYGTVGGILAKPMHLCTIAYEFVRRHRRLPSAEECRQWVDAGRWRVTAPA